MDPIEKLASEHYPEYYSIGLGNDKIGFERGYNLGISSQTEISDSGKDTADYLDKIMVKALVEASKSIVIPEISEEEIEKAATKYATNHGMMAYIFPEKKEAFIDAIKWYREQLKNKP